jgi:hypothetical protein
VGQLVDRPIGGKHVGISRTIVCDNDLVVDVQGAGLLLQGLNQRGTPVVVGGDENRDVLHNLCKINQKKL